MTAQIFKQFFGTLAQFKSWLAEKDSEQVSNAAKIGDALVFIHEKPQYYTSEGFDATFTLEGYIYANGLFYKMSDVQEYELTAEKIAALVSEDSACAVEVTEDGKLYFTPIPVVAEDEKVISVDDETGAISSTLGIKLDKRAEDPEAEVPVYHEYIQILGKDDKVVAEVNADRFVTDGMIEKVEWKKDEEGKETNILVITWNTAAGKQATEIDMTKLVDAYEGVDAIGVAEHKISLKLAEGEKAGNVTLTQSEDGLKAEVLGKFVPGEGGEDDKPASGVYADIQGDTTSTVKDIEDALADAGKVDDVMVHHKGVESEASVVDENKVAHIDLTGYMAGTAAVMADTYTLSYTDADDQSVSITGLTKDGANTYSKDNVVYTIDQEGKVTSKEGEADPVELGTDGSAKQEVNEQATGDYAAIQGDTDVTIEELNDRINNLTAKGGEPNRINKVEGDLNDATQEELRKYSDKYVGAKTSMTGTTANVDIKAQYAGFDPTAEVPALSEGIVDDGVLKSYVDYRLSWEDITPSIN